MTAKESRLVIQEDGDITRIGFLDRNILEEAIIHQIGDEIGAMVSASSNPKLLLNFDNVEHLSSFALGILIQTYNDIRDKGGQLRLVNIDPQIYEVFKITRLNHVFQIHQTIDEAISSFK